jgi:hypothetical protein
MPPSTARLVRSLRSAVLSMGVAGVACAGGVLSAAEPGARLTALPTLFEEHFDAGADHWQATDPQAWKIVDSRQGKAYSLRRQSEYKPPHRSPLNYTLVKDLVVGDFVLEADVLSTVKDYGHRDMCLIFGYQDPAHFYYVHFGKQTDDHANQIFIVNDAAREKISTKTTPGTPWDDRWHHVKLTRDAQSGAIAVYFDDLQTPAMTAEDKNFAWGQVGLGSFDDLGDWDNVLVRGKKADENPSEVRVP